jgi:hypothetical protein
MAKLTNYTHSEVETGIKQNFSTMTDAELSKIEVYGSFWDKSHAKDEIYRRLEESRKNGKSIGDVIQFIRHGDAVEFSRNHRDGTMEAGMSVYMLVDGEVKYVGFWFDIATKPAFRGKGEIVGWGSDGEPLVKLIGKVSRAREFDR